MATEVDTSWTYDALVFLQSVLQWGWLGWILLFFTGVIVVSAFAGWIEHHGLIRIKLIDRLRFIFNTFYFLLIERFRFFEMVFKLLMRLHREHKQTFILIYIIFGAFFGILGILILLF